MLEFRRSLNILASTYELGHVRVSQEVSRGRNRIFGLGAEAGEAGSSRDVHSPVSCMMIPAPRLGGANAKTSEEVSCT